MTASAQQLTEQQAGKTWPNNIAPALQLATLAEIGAAIAVVRTVEEILGVVVSGARWILNYQRCAIAIEAPGGDHMRVYSQDTAAASFPGLTTMPLKLGLVGQMLSGHQPLRLNELSAESVADDI